MRNRKTRGQASAARAQAMADKTRRLACFLPADGPDFPIEVLGPKLRRLVLHEAAALGTSPGAVFTALMMTSAEILGVDLDLFPGL